jgi:hypothetical protein
MVPVLGFTSGLSDGRGGRSSELTRQFFGTLSTSLFRLGTRRDSGLTALTLPSKVRRMTDNRLSGLALISGPGGIIITMSLHPTGHVAAAQVEPMIRMLIAVHALALA